MAEPIKDGTYVDPVSKQTVIVQGGKVQLRNKQGTLYEEDPSRAGYEILKGTFSPATPEDMHADTVRKRDGALGPVKAGAKAAVGGIIDTATAPIVAPVGLAATLAGEENPLHFAQGSEVMENLAAIGGELTGGESEVAAREFREQRRSEAQEYPIATQVGRVGGEVAGALATGGAGAARTLVGKVATEAAVGGAMGYQQTAEDAYLANQPIAPEAALANVGLGAVLAGGVTLGLSGAGRVFSRTRSRGATPMDAPQLSSAYRAAADAVDDEAAVVLGQAPSRGFGKKFLTVANELYGDASGVVSGASPATVKSRGAIAQMLDPEARRAADLVRNSDGVLEKATDDLTTQIDALEANSRDIFEVWSDLEMKAGHVRPKLTGDPEGMLLAARGEAQQLRADFDAMVADAATYGNGKLARNTRAFIEEQARRIEKTSDAAEAFVALDKVRRRLQRERVYIGRGATRQADPLRLQQAERFGQQLEAVQERTRQLLMNDTVWGEAAGVQRNVNAQWEKFFESNRLYNRNFLTQVQETFQGRPVMRADPARVAGYVRKMGRLEGKLVDEQFRAHVRAIRDLSDAIGEGFDLGARAGSLKAIRGSADDIARTLARADETVRFVNEFDEMLKAERAGASALLGAGGGLLAGGPVGAVLGAVAGAVARPGHTALQFAGLRAMARKVTRSLERSTSRYFDSFDRMRLPRTSLPKLAGKTTKRTGSPARRTASIIATGFATKDENRRQAYVRRARELRELQANPAVGLGRLQKALGPIADDAPKFSAEMMATTGRAVAYLNSKLPTQSTIDPESYTPQLSEVIPSDDEIAEFEQAWQASTNPLGALAQLEKGMFTLAHAEALRAVYPKLYSEIQRMVLTKLREQKKPVPYAARAQLDTVLGLQGKAEPSLSPGFMSRAMERAAMVQQPNPPPPAGAVPDLAKLARTQTQEMQEVL